MRQKREHGFWVKRKEVFAKGDEANARAGHLRHNCEHVSHVTVEVREKEHIVSYSVAKWYLEEIEKIGVKL